MSEGKGTLEPEKRHWSRGGVGWRQVQTVVCQGISRNPVTIPIPELAGAKWPPLKSQEKGITSWQWAPRPECDGIPGNPVAIAIQKK